MAGRYQGFQLDVHPHRVPSRRATGCVVWARDEQGEPIFGVDVIISDQYARRMLGNDAATEAQASDIALHWAHGLIDTESWDEAENATEVLRKSDWDPARNNGAESDDNLIRRLLHAFARMDRVSSRIDYAPRLDVQGFVDVVGVDVARIRGLLAEINTRHWIEPYGYEKRPTEGEARITDGGYRRLDEIIAIPASEPTSTLNVADYIASAAFRNTFPLASRSWEHAMALLNDRPLRGGIIGYACREALQTFASELVALHQIQDAPPADQVTNRIRSAATTERFGERTADFFGALVNYWSKVYDLTQRQAKNALRENEALTDEDARRVIFHTAIVMFELSRLPQKD